MAAIMPSLQLPSIFDALQLPLLLLTNVLALTIGPRQRVLQLGFSIPAWVLLASQSLYRDYSGAWGIHYAINCGVMSLMATYLDTVLLMSPDKEGWVKLRSRVETVKDNKDEAKKSGQDVGSDGFPRDDGSVVKSKNKEVSGKSKAPIGFNDRLWWAIRLACTNRYTGWSCEVKNVPVEVDDSYPRWYVLFSLCLSLCLSLSHHPS